MSYSNIPAGKDAPNDIYVIIEIPANAAPIKYEIDKDSDALFVDRFMGTAMFYPANYGYVPNTLSLDGDPLDVLVVTPHPLVHGSVIRCRPVGKLNMEDDGGVDAILVYCVIDNILSYGSFNQTGFTRQFGTMFIFLGVVGVGRPYFDRWLMKK